MERRKDFDPIAEANDHYDDIVALCERWRECGDALEDFEFDPEEFQALAKETYPWIVRFYCAELFPEIIVRLLLSIHSFASHSEDAGAESRAASYVADTLCDLEDGFGIDGINPLYAEISPENQRFRLMFEDETIYIDTQTFDLAELADYLDS